MMEDKKNILESIIDESNELKPTHKYLDDEDILINSDKNPTNLKKDLLFFKDEILKDLKRKQIKIFEKAEDNERYMMEKIEEFNIKIQKYGEKIINLSKMIITDKTIRDKVESLIEYKNKNQEMVMTQGIQIDNLDKDLFKNVYRIDNILKESVIYPGIIGGISKFKTFHDFMDYVLKECSQNVSFRDKTAVDINNLRNNDERIINNFNNKLEKTKKAITLYIDTFVGKIDNKIKEMNDDLNNKITTYRIETMTYTENVKKATESLLKQVNSIIQAKNDIFNRFEEKINMINKENARMRKYFTGYKNEFNEMRRMFKEMLEALNTKDFSSINRKMKRLSRRQTMMNNDFKVFENNLNKVVHPISMNDMFMSEDKNFKPRFSVRNSIFSREKEKKNLYAPFLKEFKIVETESKRLSKLFEKENAIQEKKNKDKHLNFTKKEKLKKKHKKKVKYFNEIFLLYNGQNNIELIKRRLNKYNSICVPNKRLGINILHRIPFGNINLEKTKSMRVSNKINNKKNNKEKKSKKILNLNLGSIYDTSISKSQNSIFSQSSKSSEKSVEKRKNNIKTKYATNVVIKENQELELSKTLNDEEIIDQFKIKLNQKDLKEEKDSKILLSSVTQSNFYENKKGINDYIQKNNNIKEEQNNKKIKIKQKEKEKANELNKIYITIEGSNQLEIDPNSKKNNQTQKNIIKNVKSIMNDKMGKTSTGFPKIVTNNGERIIYSSHPVYKKQNFNSYTNPNIVALRYSIHNLYENNDKLNKTKKGKIETSPDYIFQNKQLLSKMKNSVDFSSDNSKKVSFSLFKSTSNQNNFFMTQKKFKEDDKI